MFETTVWSSQGETAGRHGSTAPCYEPGMEISYVRADLEEPVLPKCHTRFRHSWHWTGGEALLMSRATDETGYAQPTLAELEAARGRGTEYHYNHVLAWRVRPDGRVLFGLESA